MICLCVLTVNREGHVWTWRWTVSSNSAIRHDRGHQLCGGAAGPLEERDSWPAAGILHARSNIKRDPAGNFSRKISPPFFINVRAVDGRNSKRFLAMATASFAFLDRKNINLIRTYVCFVHPFQSFTNELGSILVRYPALPSAAAAAVMVVVVVVSISLDQGVDRKMPLLYRHIFMSYETF